MIEYDDKLLTVQEAVELFLSERRSSDHGDWANPTDGDMNLLDEIIYGLIEQKFERDCDGDLPLRYHVLDRTKYEPLTYLDIPHTGMDSTMEERLKNIEMYSMLVRIYSDRVDAGLRSLRYLQGDDTK